MFSFTFSGTLRPDEIKHIQAVAGLRSWGIEYENGKRQLVIAADGFCARAEEGETVRISRAGVEIA